jgi:hypothetical protein
MTAQAHFMAGPSDASEHFFLRKSQEWWHFHAILENLFVGGCGAAAPINIGLRGVVTIRLDIFSASRETETGLMILSGKR